MKLNKRSLLKAINNRKIDLFDLENELKERVTNSRKPKKTESTTNNNEKIFPK